jgi:hypothetical protein
MPGTGNSSKVPNISAYKGSDLKKIMQRFQLKVLAQLLFKKLAAGGLPAFCRPSFGFAVGRATGQWLCVGNF